MVNFCLKVAQIGDLSSKIQWFEAFDLACAIYRWKMTIGLKSKHFSLKKWHPIFFSV